MCVYVCICVCVCVRACVRAGRGNCGRCACSVCAAHDECSRVRCGDNVKGDEERQGAEGYDNRLRVVEARVEKEGVGLAVLPKRRHNFKYRLHT